MKNWWWLRVTEINEHAEMSFGNYLDGVGWHCPYFNPLWRFLWFRAFRRHVESHHLTARPREVG